MAERPSRPSIFIDADVLIAGSASAGGARRLVLQLAELGLIEGVSSAQAREEVERNLSRKLPAARPAFRLLADAACRWTEDPDPSVLVSYEGQAHPKDLPILVAAILAGCDSLLTFNTRDYRPAARAIRIETPGEFIARLRARLARLAEE